MSSTRAQGFLLRSSPTPPSSPWSSRAPTGSVTPEDVRAPVEAAVEPRAPQGAARAPERPRDLRRRSDATAEDDAPRPERPPRRRPAKKAAGQEGRRPKKAAAPSRRRRRPPRRRPRRRPPRRPPAEDRRRRPRGRRPTSPVVGPDGKKVLPDIPDEQFEKDVATDPTIKEDEKEATFVVSDGRRDRRARAAGHGRRRHRRPGQGLPQADRQGPAAQRRDGGRARQAHRGRPVLRGEARPRAARSRPKLARGARVDRRGRPPRQEPPARGQPPPGGLAWPSATPAAACSSST